MEKAGLARSATVYKRSKLEEANDIELEKTRLWLIGFKAGYVDKYEEAHAVVPQGVWDIYKAVNIKGTHEQQDLILCKKVMQIEWKQRPDILQRTNAKKTGKKKKNRVLQI